MRKNVKTNSYQKRQSTEVELRRSVMACLLWEDSFYESGEDHASRVEALALNVSEQFLSDLAIEARDVMKLRHMPLFLTKILASRRSKLTSDTLYHVIQRPDELAEFLALYWENGRCPLSAQVKKGLAKAFTKFNEYSLAKYNRDADIKLRDVMFLVHPKPLNSEQELLWKRLVDNELATPDTWEVELSKSTNKTASWTRLLQENKLGALALLRNLRNMLDANVDIQLIRSAITRMKPNKVLPFRFISAAKYAPRIESDIEAAMLRELSDVEKLPGKTLLVVDASGSMFGTPLSAKSDLERFDAACALSILLKEICGDVETLLFSHTTEIVPSARRGFALRDAMLRTAQRGGTDTPSAIRKANELGYDRIIVITDEQDNSGHSRLPAPLPDTQAYIINVAGYSRGINYGSEWNTISGWSEGVVTYIQNYETMLVESDTIDVVD